MYVTAYPAVVPVDCHVPSTRSGMPVGESVVHAKSDIQYYISVDDWSEMCGGVGAMRRQPYRATSSCKNAGTALQAGSTLRHSHK
jgi:hypothetical protein